MITQFYIADIVSSKLLLVLLFIKLKAPRFLLKKSQTYNQ